MARTNHHERSRCADIVGGEIDRLTKKLVDPNLQLSIRQKHYLRRAIIMLKNIRDEILGISQKRKEPEADIIQGDFTPEEMDRARAILDELRNPFE